MIVQVASAQQSTMQGKASVHVFATLGSCFRAGDHCLSECSAGLMTAGIVKLVSAQYPSSLAYI